MKKASILVLCLLIVRVVQAQALKDQLIKLVPAVAEYYLEPLVSGFGTDLNSGWFHRAPRPVLLGFDIEAGVVGMGTFFRNEDKKPGKRIPISFEPIHAIRLADKAGTMLPAKRQQVISELMSQQFTVEIAGVTVIGQMGQDLKIYFPGTSIAGISIPADTISIPVSSIKEAQLLPLITPQISIGTIVGTNFTFRIVPKVTIDKDIGAFSYFGAGIQHNPAVWLDSHLPIDIGIGVYVQKMKLDVLGEATASAVSINVSKQIGWGWLNLTPYAGYMRERSNTAISYQYAGTSLSGNPVTRTISFDIAGRNSHRFTAGAGITILLANVNLDYSIGEQQAVSAGVMVRF